MIGGANGLGVGRAAVKCCAALLLVFPAVLCGVNQPPEQNYVEALVIQSLSRCFMPGAVDVAAGEAGGYAWNCRSRSVSTGLIYLNATGTALATVTSPAGTELDCRCSNGTLNSARYGRWYRSDLANPPSGYRLTFLENQGVQLSGTEVTAVLPFTNFSAGDTLYCIPTAAAASYELCELLQKVTIQ